MRAYDPVRGAATSRSRSSPPSSSIRKEPASMPDAAKPGAAMPDLAARGAFDGLLAPAGEGRGVVVEARSPQLATVTALAAGQDAVARVLDGLGLALPGGPRRVVRDGAAVLGLGPRSWLVAREGGAPLAAELTRALAELPRWRTSRTATACCASPAHGCALCSRRASPSTSTTAPSRRARPRRRSAPISGSCSGAWTTRRAQPCSRSPCRAASREAFGTSWRRVPPSTGSGSRP